MTSNISKMNFFFFFGDLPNSEKKIICHRPWSLLRRVLPYVNMSLKGWIWYQGENDMHGFLDKNVRGAKVMMRRKPVCPLFWVLAHPKQGLFQSKQESFGLQIHIYIYIYTCIIYICIIYGYGSSRTIFHF